MSFDWTPERVAEISKLWLDGIPASDIAARFQGLSRNAVIGKVTRLGICRPSPARSGTQINRRVRRVPVYAARRKPLLDQAEELAADEAVSLPPEQSACAVTMMQLEHHHCRWPIDGADGAMMYCGANHLDGGSYCPRHHRLAYQRARPRADRYTGSWRAA